MPSPKGHPPYNKNGEGGRPKIYTKEFIDKEADALEEWMKDKNNLFIEFFAFDRDYNEDKIAYFEKENERFRRAYKKFKMKQKAELFSGGLKRKYAHPMCALILSHSHGVHQKTEQKITGSATDPLSFIVQEIDGLTKDLLNDEAE